MRLLNNDDVARVLNMHDTIRALRIAYQELRRHEVSYVPLVWLYAPTSRTSDYYRCGATTGNSAQFDVVAVRIKSDVVSWPHGATEEKYCIEPGTFCGLIMLFSSIDGRPLAIIQDGLIQHMRVGASAALGVDLMARTDASTLGLLGSGGMARSYLEAIACVRGLEQVRIYSPTTSHLAAFARDVERMVPGRVEAVESAEAAVRGADIVATATDSIQPTFDPSWVSPGSHVTCVSRRELAAGVYERATIIAQLGHNSIPRDTPIPGMQWIKGGLSAYIAGSEAAQKRIPRGDGASVTYPTITQILGMEYSSKRDAADVSLFLNTGTQGVQFAAVAGHVLALADRAAVGRLMPTDWFTENIRD